jgi:hypothetical protein
LTQTWESPKTCAGLVSRQTRQIETNDNDRLLRVDVEKKVERCKGGIAELFTGDLVNRTEESKIAMGLLNRG